LLDTANTKYDASEANVTTHTTEKAAFVAIFDTAVALVATKLREKNDATQAWEVATEDKTGCQPSADGTYAFVTHPCKTYLAENVTTASDRAADTVNGTQRLESLALVAKGTADDAVTNFTHTDNSTAKKITGATTNDASWALDLRTANIALIKKTAEKFQYDAAVTAAKFDTNDDDGVFAVKVTSLTTETNAASAANVIWEAARDAYTALQVTAGIKDKENTLAIENDTTQDGVISPLL